MGKQKFARFRPSLMQSMFFSIFKFLYIRSLENISKIGEGVYSEVFQANKSSVIKIFPIDGNIPVNGEKQMESDRVYPEVFISK